MKMTKKVVEKKKLVPVVTKETRYLLDLDLQEAQFLRDIMDRIGGCPSASRRKHAVKLIEVLRGAGVHHIAVGQKHDMHPGQSIYFKDTDA